MDNFKGWCTRNPNWHQNHQEQVDLSKKIIENEKNGWFVFPSNKRRTKIKY